MRTLTTEEVRRFYDRMGPRQDSQVFYEGRALDALVGHSQLHAAQDVFEFGCGTGRFARQLLEHHLPSAARYQGVDISPRMVGLASRRLERFGERASVALAGDEPVFPLEDQSIDRVVSVYVFDLLPEPAIREILSEAKRVLREHGLVCLAGITDGVTRTSAAIMRCWAWVFTRRPSWVGGCRPIRLADHLPQASWNHRYHATIVAWGIASEVLVASPRDGERRT